MNSIDASLSVPTAARQPLLSRVDASASAFPRLIVKSSTLLISAPLIVARGVEAKFHVSRHGSCVLWAIRAS